MSTRTELHCHLDGSVRPRTIARLAEHQRVDLPGSPDVLARAPRRCHSLEDYISAIDIALTVLQTPDALHVAAEELVEQWSADGVSHGEVRFAPQLHTARGLQPTEVLQAVTVGLAAGTARTGVRSAVIACAMRNASPAATWELVEAAAAADVVGVDIAGPQIGHPLRPHAPAIRAAREHGLRVTIHAGETDGAEDIWVAIDELGAERIGHGVKAADDRALMNRLIQDGIALELCPTSNVQTGAVSSLSSHPVDRLFRAGVPVTISTDARTVSDTTLAGEYDRLASQFGWTTHHHDHTQRIASGAAFRSRHAP